MLPLVPSVPVPESLSEPVVCGVQVTVPVHSCVVLAGQLEPPVTAKLLVDGAETVIGCPSGAVPGPPTVNVCAALVVPSACAANVRLCGLTFT